MDRLVYCADVIARLDGPEGPLVIIERLSSVPGLALPGGKQEAGEMLSQTALREFREETGLGLVLTGVLGTDASYGRDPRGRYVTTTFTGIAYGVPKDEPGKTRVLLVPELGIAELCERFVFGHEKVLAQYLASD